MKDKAEKMQDDFFNSIKTVNSNTLGLTGYEIANRSGLSPSYYSMLVNGIRPLSVANAVRISAVFNLELEYTYKNNES